jgi:hypothetical protein
MSGYVVLPLREVIWRCCNGRGSEAALGGMKTYVGKPLLKVI